MSLAERIREARKAKGWSQHTLAKFFGIGNGVISLWESGRAIPDAAKIQRLASILGRDPTWFIGGEGHRQP
jgi:transcriptional regulator with XRE-family HTH domain